jgi:hypothetical protein
MASTATYKCARCGDPFTARTADRARGWARFCSKSCKAVKQEQRTGQFRDLINRQNDFGLCFPSGAEGDIQ